MELREWHERLHEHFKLLSGRRQSQPAKPPVFALEHGLTANEVQEIRERVRAHIKRAMPNDTHRLAWIVYATELGYGYEGDEYWQTFEHETPGWQQYGDRYWIRRAFVSFHRQYGGAQPTGDWAEHFSIIAWPIHHAILPRYLQTHFAKLLYDTKYAINAKLLRDSRRLGEFLHRESEYGSNRLYAFTEQTDLSGRIAAALLLRKTEESTGLLTRETFERLVADLERESQARVWLKAAQDQARRTVLSGLGHGGGGVRNGPSGHEKPEREAGTGRHVPPALKGQLVALRRSEVEFDLQIELPDFSQLLADYPHLGDLLANSRCTVAGTSGRPRPRGWLMDGPQTALLQNLPKRDESLLKFEDVDASLRHLFRTDELLPWEHAWLLKIGADGNGYGVRSHNVRPGQSYILLYPQGVPGPAPGLSKVTVNCTGVSAWRLTVPHPLPQHFEDLLGRLHLNPWRTVHFWPAGLPAPQWDGEGFAEWLSTDPVWIGVRSDHEIRAVTFRLDRDEDQLTIRPADPGEPVFIELPPLALGAHKLSAVVTPRDESRGEQHGNLDIWIRNPRIRQLTRARLLCVVIDPPTAGFQGIWESRAQVTLSGPFVMDGSVTVELLAPGAESALASTSFPIRLPLTAHDWKIQFEEHIRGVAAFEEAAEDANRMRILVEAAGVDKLERVFERPVAPLRWKTGGTRGATTLTLVSHFDEGTEPTATFYALATPDSAQSLAFRQVAAGLLTPEPGLYYAAGLRAETGVLVPRQVSRLQDLGLNLTFRKYPKSFESVNGLLKVFERWHAARVLGDLSAFSHRRRILEGLVGKLFDCIASEPIVIKVLAQASSDGVCGEGHLRFLVRTLPCSTLAQGLINEHGACVKAGAATRLRTFRHAIYLYGCPGLGLKPSAEPLFEFALRLASAPETVRNWRKAEFESYLRELVRIPMLALAARIWVLLIAQRSRTPLGASALYAGWDWV